MFVMHVELGKGGEWILRHLAPLYVEALQLVPRILEERDAGVDERLFPESYPADAEKEREWRRLGRPELEALLLSRRELIERDLTTLAPESKQRGSRMVIAAPHKNAWLTGLNAARLTLAVSHGVEAADMERELELESMDDREVALLKIHLLGHIQGMLVEAEGG